MTRTRMHCIILDKEDTHALHHHRACHKSFRLILVVATSPDQPVSTGGHWCMESGWSRDALRFSHATCVSLFAQIFPLF